MRWDGGRALEGLDLDDWASRFNVEYVDEDLLDDCAAIHQLTTLGKKLGLGEWDVLIARDFMLYSKYIVTHEVAENYLRRRGWLYEPSHRYALRLEDSLFGSEPSFKRYRRK